MKLDLNTGDGMTISGHPPQNADTANDTPAFPTTNLNEAVGVKGPVPDFSPSSALFRLRMRFPNLQIIPVPPATRTRILLANAAQDMTLPDGTIAVLFFATAPFWVNFNGKAALPTANEEGQSMFIPTNFLYMMYVVGKGQISVFAEQPTTVQAFCYIDLPADHK